MKKSYWFYLEPYVHVSVKRNRVLLYNPLNGKVIESENDPEIVELVSQLQAMENLLVLNITEEDIQNPVIAEFITNTRNLFMGDLIDTKFMKKKPFQIIPKIRVLRDIEKFKKEDRRSIGIELMTYLSEISIYINKGKNNGTPLMEDAYKQFLFPRKDGDKEEILPLEDIKNLINEAAGSSLYRINILGGNIFEYPEFKELAGLLNALSIIKTFYFHYADLHEQTDIKNLILSNWKPGTAEDDIRWELDVLVPFPVEIEKLADAVTKVHNSGINTKFHFILQKEEELELAEKLISQFELSDYSFLPYYNGKNLNFFEDAVFDDKETVLESRPTQRDIFIRMVINQTAFGKLTILSNGDIYANVNEPALGKLGKDSIYDLVYKEVCEGRSWRRRRSDLAPCTECIYQYLCPSTSNYEYAIGRNNLCHIWECETTTT